MNKFVLLFAVVITLLTACKKSTSQNPVVVVVAVSDPLAKGINLSNWFNDYSDPSQYATYWASHSF